MSITNYVKYVKLTIALDLVFFPDVAMATYHFLYDKPIYIAASDFFFK